MKNRGYRRLISVHPTNGPWAKIDWKSFEGKFDKKKSFGVAEVGAKCHEAVELVGKFCGSSERKQRGVAESLSAMSCVFDSGADLVWKLKNKSAVVGYGKYQDEVFDLKEKHFDLAFLTNGGLAEQEYWSKTLQTEAVARAEKACGKKFKINIDWPGFAKNFIIEKGSNKDAETVYYSCRSMVGNIQAWCGARTSVEKRAERIKAGLTGMTCKWDKNATWKKLNRGGATHKVKKKHLTVGWSWKTKNPPKDLHEFFLAHFKIDQSHMLSAKKTLQNQFIQAYKKRKCKTSSCRRRCSSKHRVRE